MKTLVLLATLCFLMTAQAAQALEVGQWVSFSNAYTGRFDEGEVVQIANKDDVTIRVMVYGEHTAGPQFFKAKVEQLAVEVDREVDGLYKGLKICSAKTGQEGEVTRVYENGTAQVTFGDFFGKRFLFFERTEVLDFTGLKECK